MIKIAKAQILRFTFMVIVFLILFGVLFAKLTNDMGQQAVTVGNLTGLEAFVFSNIPLFLLIGFFLFISAFLYLGGGVSNQ